jgi:hypothetical protein
MFADKITALRVERAESLVVRDMVGALLGHRTSRRCVRARVQRPERNRKPM